MEDEPTVQPFGEDPQLPSPEQLGEAGRDLLTTARDLARLTRYPKVEAGHLALALLSTWAGSLDPLLGEAFPGVCSATLTGSLLDILEIEADLTDSVVGSFPEEGLPPTEHLSPEALAALARAAEIAAGGDGPISVESLASALFAHPPRPLTEAFQDAGVSRAAVEALGAKLAEAGGIAPAAAPLAVFQEGVLQLAAFGPLARRVLAALARKAAAEPGSRLDDHDLLAGFLAEEGSRLGEALHIMGLGVASIRRNLSRARPAAAPPAGAGSPATTLPEERLSRLLRRVLTTARELAAAEGHSTISESQLLRAHLDRVAGSDANLYQRLGIDTLRLRDYLRRRPADDPDVAAPPATTPVENVEDIEAYLLARVINQEAAIRHAVPALRRLRVGLAEPGRPAGSFLFLGPTGVGKTELTRAIAEVAFGAEPQVRDPFLIKLDCGNFQEPRDIVQLLGAPQGLVGYKEGQLTKGLAVKPRAVILFDEAEKACREIWQSLLPLFDEGIVREADGTEYDATGCLLIATSNLGYAEAASRFQLWERELTDGTLPAAATDFIWGEVEAYFSPEFRGRFGRKNVLFFNHFDRRSYRAIVELQIARLAREMAGKGYEVTVPEAAVEHLTGLAWEEREAGARPVRRLITEHLRDQMVTALLTEPQRTRFNFTALEGRGEILLEPA